MRALLLFALVLAAGCGRSGVLFPGDERGPIDVPFPHAPGDGNEEAPKAFATEWVVTLGGVEDDAANAIALGFGRVALAGSFRGEADLGDSAITTADGADDAVVAGLATAGGAYAWHAVAGGTAADVAQAVSVDPDGRVVMGGRVDSATADLGFGSVFGSGDGEGDRFVTAYTAAGAPLWANLSLFAGRDEVYAMSWTGFVFAAGDEDASASDVDSSLERRNAVGGVVVGGVNHQAAAADEHLRATAANAAASVYLGAGFFTGDATYAGAAVTAQAEDAIAFHAVTAGAVDWHFQLGGSGNDRATAVAHTPLGWVIAGEFEGTALVAGTSMIAAGGTDVFVALVDDADGSLLWVRRAGGPGDDHVAGAGEANGIVQIAGTYEGVFLPGGGLDPLAPATAGSFVMAFDALGSGKPLAVSRISGEGVLVTGLAVGANGDAYLSGSFTGAADLGLGSVETSAGGSDAFALRGRLELFR